MSFKLLGLIFLCNFAAFPSANLDDQIKKNEEVINSLQEILDKMQAEGGSTDKIKPLQDHLDEVIANQNKLLEAKATGSTSTTLPTSAPDTEQLSTQESLETPSTPLAKTLSVLPSVNAATSEEEKIRTIVREELAKAQHQEPSTKPFVPGTNPYDAADNKQHIPTEKELQATHDAENKAPELPEANSEAIAQYQQALNLYNKGAYKESAASFSRIVKAYPTDPIADKALVHLAFSLEKQNKLNDAVIVCETAITKNIDDLRKADCYLICLKAAKADGNDQKIKIIKNSLDHFILTSDQKNRYTMIMGEPPKEQALSQKPAQPAAAG